MLGALLGVPGASRVRSGDEEDLNRTQIEVAIDEYNEKAQDVKKWESKMAIRRSKLVELRRQFVGQAIEGLPYNEEEGLGDVNNGDVIATGGVVKACGCCPKPHLTVELTIPATEAGAPPTLVRECWADDEVRPFLVEGDFTYEAQVQDPAKRLPLQKELEQAKAARAGGAKKRKRGE